MQLREISNADIKLMKQWLLKPHVVKWFKHPEAWIDEIEQRNTTYSFIKHFIVEEDNKPIGFCQYYDYALGKEDWHGNFNINNCFSIDYMLGEESYLHQGKGKEMVSLLTTKVFINAKVRCIIVQPEKDNLVSRKTLLGCGYQYDKINDIFYMINNNYGKL